MLSTGNTNQRSVDTNSIVIDDDEMMRQLLSDVPNLIQYYDLLIFFSREPVQSKWGIHFVE
jgi:hypothetical protein